jgi:hypothetical protein
VEPTKYSFLFVEITNHMFPQVFLKIVVNQASVAYFPIIGSPTILTFRYWACIVTHTCSYDFVETHAFGKLWPEPDHYEPIFVTGTSSPEGTKLFC